MAYVAQLIRRNREALGVRAWTEIDTTLPGRRQGFRWSRMRLTMQFARAIWRALAPSGAQDEPRVLHVHTGAFHSFFEKSLFIALGRLRGVRTILHIHGSGFDRFYTSAGPLGQRLVARLLRMPDRVIVLSSYWKDVVRQIRPDSANEQICVLHNGVEVPDVPKRDARQAPFKVIFIGCVGDRKGCAELLDAAARLAGVQDVQFYLLGGGDFEGDLRRYKREAALRRLANVHFLGHTTGREKEQMLRNADLFILPSHAENFPIALLEAMAYGLPVVATQVGAVPEVVEEENGLLVAPRDAEALAGAILHLYEHPGKRVAMGRKNAQKVRDRYSASRFVAGLRAIYAALEGE